MPLFDDVMIIITRGTDEEFKSVISSEVLSMLSKELPPQQFQDIIIAKNIRIYGDVNKYIKLFLEQTVTALRTMEEGPMKETTEGGQQLFIQKLLAREDISHTSRQLLEAALIRFADAAPAAGGKRMRRRQTKKRLHRKNRKGSRKVL